MDAQTKQWSAWLNSDSPQRQTDALRQISGGDAVFGVAVRCVELAGCRSDEVRMWAAEALETSVKPQPSDAKPLAGLLAGGGDGEICYWAATLLGRLGPSASCAALELEACVDRSPYLPARERAAWALSRIGPAAAMAAATLRRVAADGPPRLRRLATQALESIRGIAA